MEKISMEKIAMRYVHSGNLPSELLLPGLIKRTKQNLREGFALANDKRKLLGGGAPRGTTPLIHESQKTLNLLNDMNKYLVPLKAKAYRSLMNLKYPNRKLVLKKLPKEAPVK